MLTKNILKNASGFYRLIITFVSLPFAFIFIVLGKIAILIGSYSDLSLLISKVPFLFGQQLRYFYYKGTLTYLGQHVVFNYGTFCQYHTAKIGNRVLFGYYNTIGEVDMGDDILIGGFVNLISGTAQHSFSDRKKTIREQKSLGRRVIKLGSDIWIGSNSIIAADIGDRCIIGAGSVLVKTAQSRAVYGGNPAKLIKDIG